MTKLIKKTKSLRKTFTIPNYIVGQLEEYARDSHTKQSQVVALALEEFLSDEHKNEKVIKRLKALDGLVDIVPSGSLKDFDLKSMRVGRYA